MSRMLITGGAGFIGSHLAKRLVAEGHFVRVVDDLSRGLRENLGRALNKIEFIAGDLTQSEICRSACENIDVVFHLAAKVGGIGVYLSAPGQVALHNSLLDMTLFAAVRDSQVQKLVYASSAHVYPEHLQNEADSAPLKEADAAASAPALSYGWAKLNSERVLEYLLSEDVFPKTAIARITGAYGEGQDIDLETASAIPAFCRRAIECPEKGSFSVFGDGLETRSYCFIDDIVDALVLLEHKLEAEQTIGPLNLGNGGRISIGDLARLVIEISGKSADLDFLPAKNSALRGQAIDVTLLNKILPEWKPQISLHEGVSRVYRDIEKRLRKDSDRILSEQIQSLLP